MRAFKKVATFAKVPGWENSHKSRRCKLVTSRIRRADKNGIWRADRKEQRR